MTYFAVKAHSQNRLKGSKATSLIVLIGCLRWGFEPLPIVAIVGEVAIAPMNTYVLGIQCKYVLSTGVYR